MNSDHYLSYENILGCMRHFRVNKAQNKAKRGVKIIKSTIVPQIMTWNCSTFLSVYLNSKYGRNIDHYLSYGNILVCMRHFRINKAQNTGKSGSRNTNPSIVTQIVALNCPNCLGW